MASSEMEAMIGTVRIPTPRPAASNDANPIESSSGCSTCGVMKLRANRPSTTDGMLASVSMIGLMI